MTSRKTRVLLFVMGATTLGFGCAYLLAPQKMAALSGLAITRRAAEAELRGYYGGLQVGMGVLFLSGLFSTRMARAGVLSAMVLFAGNGVGRLLGVALAGSIDSFNIAGAAFELLFAGAAFYVQRENP